MSISLLLPNKYKKIGWCLLIPAFITGSILCVTDYQAPWLQAKIFAFVYEELLGQSHFFRVVDINMTNTLVGALFIIGSMLVTFSKETIEDEFIANLRLKSLQWSLLVNNILLLLAFLFVYGITFLSIMVYNMFTMSIIFIIRFNYILYKNSKSSTNEK